MIGIWVMDMPHLKLHLCPRLDQIDQSNSENTSKNKINFQTLKLTWKIAKSATKINGILGATESMLSQS